MLKQKKGQVFDQLSNLVLGIAALTIVAIVVFLILANLGANTQVVADSNASAAVVTLTNAAGDIPDWVPIVVITIIGGILISLVAVFRGRR